MATIDPKFVVIAALFYPALSLFLEWDTSAILYAGAAAIGFYIFDNNFVNKLELDRSRVPQLGPQQPFRPTDIEYDIDPDTGLPVPKTFIPRRR
jgi:hypothetical protein